MAESSSTQLPDAKRANTVVLMQGIRSHECFLREGGIVPILAGIDLEVSRGQAFGVDGNSPFALKLLLEIMANIRPYDQGRCVLHERGMMRKKRVIHPDVFYIGNPHMAYPNMNVLEFLMFARMKQPDDKIDMQEQMLEYLIEIGFKGIALSPVRSLPREYRAAMLLLASAYSNSSLIVFNLPEYRYDANAIKALSNIAKLILGRQKTLVLSSQDGDVLQACCTHMAFMTDGIIAFAGGVDDFRKTFDTALLTIRDEQAPDMERVLLVRLPQYRYIRIGDTLTIHGDAASEEDAKAVIAALLEYGLLPKNIQVNPKTVNNAREEFMHAVHQGLF